MKKLLFLFSITLIFGAISVSNVYAGECFSDAIYDHDWTGTVTTGVRIRDVACMEGSTVLTTVAVGEQVTITGETDGWWRVKLADGTEGWAGEWLIEVSDTSGGIEVTTTANPEPTTTSTPTPTTTTTSGSLTSRLAGHILLQVEDHGEAWYVHPIEQKRYYMKDGETAYEMMRKFGLGISNVDLASLQAGNAELVNRLKGRIVLQVEKLGEAFYIHPTAGTVTYLKDGPAAYSIMREQSLGITNADLAKIASTEFTALSYSTTPSTTTPEATITTEQFIPSNINLTSINEYWLDRVNTLRATQGLRQLVIDDRWIETATEYATYMGETGATAHERADGSSMHDWIDQQGLEFTVRYSEDGWNGNYFTENISWGNTDNSTGGLIRVLEDTMGFYLSEADYNGPHYRTVYHEDWNSVGAGFYFEDLGGDQYKVYTVFHYGSLQM